MLVFNSKAWALSEISLMLKGRFGRVVVAVVVAEFILPLSMSLPFPLSVPF